jgi:outer membrane protein OmpA-like peptidoglycan-associated protein
MKTQKRKTAIKSFIALFAMMITVSSSAFSQEQSGVKPAASRAGADTVKQDSVGAQNLHPEKSAQQSANPDFCRHEFLVWAGGGWSSLNTFPTYGDRDYRFGGLLGFGYSYHFTEHWSILAGVELALYNMKMTVEDLTDRFTVQDPDGDTMRYSTRINSYKEKQRLFSLNIPLQARYMTPVGSNGHLFYAALGFKLGIPLKTRYKSYDEDVVTYGYYPEWNQTLYEQTDLGHGTWDASAKQEGLKLGLSYMGTAEAGIRWKLSNPKLNLYTGLWFDYGFNNMLKESGKTFLEYDYPSGTGSSYTPHFKTNSVLSSQYTKDGKTDDYTDKVSTVALGIKVQLGVNLCHIDKKKDGKNKDGESKDVENKDDIDPYRKGYRDAMQDGGQGGNAASRRSAEPAAPAAAPERRNAKPLDYTPAPERKEPYYQGDPLLEAEMKRAQAEYGKLKDLLVMYVDGYEVNQSKLSPVMEKMIDDKIKLLQKYNSDRYIIICEGHTCDLGREEFNMNLAQKRAEVVREYLTGKGFKADNLVAASKGESTPIVPNDSETNRKINRRVVFLIKEKH